ncbi:hypothetical protein AUJ30_00585 [Candidatus Wolfebacteria bacterium CG1_02_39_135]|nr:hypothetical protein [Candidatus Falkowbacteria bacterium]NCO15568.1 hypothetical protein [Parcubacteria group bacterium]OIO65733.1 MAG: hypothetical protein AUJ30_00585 [Candidatus Wolfebacteria bacterium CG1_02_39_135]PIY58997.1 MAG: hypothetical protein COY97_01270 [Candidatus Wolfebacteria bacterium CG_4_10_14_0_8_um_filter_39_64]
MATITISKKLNKEVKSFIVQAIYEVLNDPDFRLELNEKAKKRLRRALIPKQKTIPFSEIKKRYY